MPLARQRSRSPDSPVTFAGIRTQKRLGIANVPRRPETYNALYALAVNILDPVIEYFGPIRLTYGFCSAELGKHIKARVAPELDQHASYELRRNGKLICGRGGAACDFLVEDEDMREVADWIIDNTPYDRLYFYGSEKPLHVSFSPSSLGLAFQLLKTETGKLVPTPYKRSSEVERLRSYLPRA